MSNAVEKLIDQAWEARTPSKRAMFARRALALDRTAVDAYVALALTVETAAERIALLREGVRHGEALWQPFLKRAPNGYFWGDVETRPFMRAMHNLALALWECGDGEAAASLADRILRLNPNDNQGIRYLALAWHPVLGNWPRVEALLKKYKNGGGADYLYARCLDRFRQGGDAEGALDDAMEANPHVPALLLAARPAPRTPGAMFIEVGSHDEALAYAAMHRAAWAAVPSALDWLRGALRQRMDR